MNRSNHWSEESDDILRKWYKQAERLERLHRRREHVLRRYSTFFMVGSITVSAGAAVLGIAFYDDCKMDPISYCKDYFVLPVNITHPEVQTECYYQKWLRLSSAILGGISAGISAIREFLNYTAKADEEKEASDEFGALARSIDELLRKSWSDRGDPGVIISHIRTTYDHITNHSPSVDDGSNDENSGDLYKQSMIFAPKNPSGKRDTIVIVDDDGGGDGEDGDGEDDDDDRGSSPRSSGEAESTLAFELNRLNHYAQRRKSRRNNHI